MSSIGYFYILSIFLLISLTQIDNFYSSFQKSTTFDFVDLSYSTFSVISALIFIISFLLSLYLILFSFLQFLETNTWLIEFFQPTVFPNITF